MRGLFILSNTLRVNKNIYGFEVQMTSLLADIGGTNVRFSFVKGTSATLLKPESYKVADFSTIEDAVLNYCSKHKISPTALSFCVAAPVTQNEVVFTNNHWKFKKDALKNFLGAEKILCLNDFTAQALSQIPYFQNNNEKHIKTWCNEPTSYIHKIFNGVENHNAPLFVLGPGTGLGSSTLVPINKTFKALEAEGGHIHFPPTNNIEIELLVWLQNQYGSVSAESIISGPGLENIYRFLISRKKGPALKNKNQEPSTLSAENIGNLALAGNTIALLAVNIMFGALGTVAANGVLTTGSFRGLIISGGIIPKIPTLFLKSPFYKSFINNRPKYLKLLKKVPVYLSSDPYSGLKGCQQALINPFYKNQINFFTSH
jgi:glucokinase